MKKWNAKRVNEYVKLEAPGTMQSGVVTYEDVFSGMPTQKVPQQQDTLPSSKTTTKNKV